MFKKIEAWILYLVLLLGLLTTLGFGVLVKQELVGRKKFGNISKLALFLVEAPIYVIKKIIGDTDFIAEDRFPELTGFSGKPLKDEAYLLLSRYNLDIEQSIVELIDLKNFKTIHTWNPKFDKYNEFIDQKDEFEFLKRDKSDVQARAHHPLLTDDGGLLINDGILNKIDACSNLIWQNSHNWFHHSIEEGVDGDIWVPTHLYPQHLDSSIIGLGSQNNGGFLDDAIMKLSSDGRILFEKSVSQILIDNHLEPLLFSIGTPQFSSDPIHLNDIQPVTKDSEFMKKGDLFLSLRHQSLVLLYRPKTNKIIWKTFGKSFHQHDVDILSGSKISIFNNNSKNGFDGDFVDNHNEVLIYDFEKDEHVSYLKNSLAVAEVKTNTQGLNQILPNGNMFVEETNFGRILFYTADGQLKWSYVNRAISGKVGILSWSRILYQPTDIARVKTLLDFRKDCDD